MPQSNSSQSNNIVTIAIDGSAASGKGTLARKLAQHYGFDHLDTGKLYRSLAYAILQLLEDTQQSLDEIANVSPALIERLLPTICTPKAIQNPALTSDIIAQGASKIATLDYVRLALLKVQQDFASSPPNQKGAILDGRDIGSVICPNATVKFFIDADLKTRTQRRFDELRIHNKAIAYDDIFHDMHTRDQRDRTRALAPLIPAKDALLIDTSTLTPDALFAKACSMIAQKTNIEFLLNQ